jgi:hypothetical protein
VAVALAPRLGVVDDVRAEQAHRAALAGDLALAVRAAGGPAEVLACGRPYVARYRGPLLAYRLDVHRTVVEPDAPPRPPGVVFAAARRPGGAPAPVVGAPFERAARRGTWEVRRACRVRVP